MTIFQRRQKRKRRRSSVKKRRKAYRLKWKLTTAQLFVDIATHLKGYPEHRVIESKDMNATPSAYQIRIPQYLNSRGKWKALIAEVLKTIRLEVGNTLWHRFWREPIEVRDLELAARHHKFLEECLHAKQLDEETAKEIQRVCSGDSSA